nr:Trk system potassium transporter TrkA [Spirochaeta isovalerica]
MGAGKVGYHLARQLIHEDQHVTIIERDSHRAKQVSNQLDCIIINDEGNNLDVLRQAGLDKADFFISVTESDELNMISCGLASSYRNEVFTIARVRNIDYSHSAMSSRSLMGINQIINPEIEAAREIAKSVEHGAMSNVLQFNNTELQMLNLAVPRESSMIGQSLLQVNQTIGVTFLVPILMRDRDYIIPDGNTKFREGDLVYVIARESDFDVIFRFFRKPKVQINKIAIVGCGHLGCYVADYLVSNSEGESSLIGKLISRLTRQEQSGNLHLIDADYEQCKYLSERFPTAQVTHADITNEEVWEEELLKNFDLVISSTGNQELNLITSMYAKKVGVLRSISLVQTRAYKNIAESLGIDVSISINNVLVNTILKIIRKGNIKSIHNISGSPFEIIEFALSQSSSLNYQQIKNLKLPKETLIILVTRGEENLIPNGAMALEPGDHIVVIARKDSIKKLETLFGVG